MKTLYLIRHAKSSWKNARIADIERPLNSRGKRDAPFIGELLASKKIKPALIITSPAKRAKKTAETIAGKIGYSKKNIVYEDNIYEAGSHELLDVIKNINNKFDSAMLFGHNPGFTMLHNFLCKHYIDNIPTSGVVALEFESPWNEIEKNSAKFLFFEYPKLYLE